MGDERRSGPTRSTYAVIWDVDGMLRKNLLIPVQRAKNGSHTQRCSRG
jgi:hypothetical protein